MAEKKPVSKTKKLINAVEHCVDESLQGMVALNPGLRLLQGYRVVVRCDYQDYKASGRVCTMSGGGSGHEPAFSGFIGKGGLMASVHGPIFTAPDCKTILAAIRALGEQNPGGVLILYNNYTGDRLNFGKAMEKAMSEGMRVESVVVGEDCALMSKDKTAGRRGLAGWVIVNKILSSMAEDGKTLDEIVKFSTSLLCNLGTLGVCLSPCSLPGGPPLFQVGPDDMEIGLGLHGEAGVKRTKLMSAHDTVKTMIAHVSSASNPSALHLPPGASIGIFLNNLGSTSQLEMNILTMEAITQLEQQGFKVERAYAGACMTSQEMAGFSLSIFLLDDVTKYYLDYPTDAVAWPRNLLPPEVSDRFTPTPLPVLSAPSNTHQHLTGHVLQPEVAQRLYHVLLAACNAVIDAEDMLNQLDTSSGDGDCGSTLKSGAQALLKALGPKEVCGYPLEHPYNLLLMIADTVEESMGGSSGGLYSLFFTACARPCLGSDCTLATVLRSGIDALCKYGGAEPGDRTMIDPLEAACQELQKNPTNLEEAVKAAERRAQETASMVARAGRASYVDAARIIAPDSGAMAVALWSRAGLQAWSASLN